MGLTAAAAEFQTHEEPRNVQRIVSVASLCAAKTGGRSPVEVAIQRLIFIECFVQAEMHSSRDYCNRQFILLKCSQQNCFWHIWRQMLTHGGEGSFSQHLTCCVSCKSTFWSSSSISVRKRRKVDTAITIEVGIVKSCVRGCFWNDTTQKGRLCLSGHWR